MKLLRKITVHLPLVAIVAMFAATFITIKNNLNKKSRIVLNKNLVLVSERAIATSTLSYSSSQKKVEVKNVQTESNNKTVVEKKVKAKLKKTSAVVKNKKPLQKGARLKKAKRDSRELSHKDVVKVFAFHIEKPRATNWVAYLNEYSNKKNVLVAKSIDTQPKKTPKQNPLEEKEVALVPVASLIEIPKLEELNLGYESVSLEQYLDEYKIESSKAKAEKFKKTASDKTISVPVQAVIKKEDVPTQRPAIKKIKQDKEEMKQQSKQEAQRDKEEKLASVTGSTTSLWSDLLNNKMTNQKPFAYPLTIQLKDNDINKLSIQNQSSLSRSPAIVEEETSSIYPDSLIEETITLLEEMDEVEVREPQTQEAAIVSEYNELDAIIDEMEPIVSVIETPAAVATIDVKELIEESKREFELESAQIPKELLESEDSVKETMASNEKSLEQEEEARYTDEDINEAVADLENIDETIVEIAEPAEDVETIAENVSKENELDSIIDEMNDKFEEIKENKQQNNSAITTQTTNSAKQYPPAQVNQPLRLIPIAKAAKTGGAPAPAVNVVAAAQNEGSANPLSKEEAKNIMGNIGEIPADLKNQVLNTIASSLEKTKENPKEVAVVYKKQRPVKSSLKINVDSIEVNKKISKKQSGFDIRFNDNADDVYGDHGKGYVEMRTKLNNRMSVRSANIVLYGHLPTNTDLVFEPENFEIDVPLFESRSFEAILDKNKLSGRGGHLLVQLDSEGITDEVQIDKKYEAKLHLNNKFQVVDPESSDYLYLLFIGVEPGNALLTYITKNKDSSSKIIFVTEAEFFFDTNEYIHRQVDEFELVENHLLGSKNLQLVIDKSEINILASNKQPNKKSLNRYVYKNLITPLGTRQYNELKHLRESIFMGRWQNSVVEIPSQDYIQFIMNKFRLDRIGSQCIVQINLGKEVKRFASSARSTKGFMRLERKILDNDGQIYEDVSEITTKIFLVGEQQGIINAKISYLDGSYDYLQTYCSEDTYLIEQM